MHFSLFLSLMMVVSACGGPKAGSSPAEKSNSAAKISAAGKVLSEVPGLLDPSAHYLIYLHGAIMETQGMRPVSPKFGPYEYGQILQTFAERGFVVISETRSRRTRPDVFAHHVADQVHRLLDGGVPADHVTVLGFSKGGAIATLASGEVLRDHVNWVIEAGCGPWIEKMPRLKPHGRILSIYDSADDIASSCSDLFARMGEKAETRELVLDLGKGHGAFYTPDPAWVEPVIQWAGL